MPNMNKDKLTKKKMLDGMFTPEESKLDNTQSIDDIIGGGFMENPWKANSQEEFDSRLKEMNLADMQVLATKVGLLPVHDRAILKRRLVKEFNKFLQKKNRKPAPQSEHELDKKLKNKWTKKETERVNSILKEGK